MKNWILLSGNLASSITFTDKGCFFRFEQHNPVFLNIACIVWNQNIVKIIKSQKMGQGDQIMIKGMIKSNNYVKKSAFESKSVYVNNYEIRISEINIDGEWMK